MVEHKNIGLTVSNAKRLNDCYHQLCEAIGARPAVNGDRNLWQYYYAALPGELQGPVREDWNHRSGSNDVALVALRGAVANGNLQLWTSSSHGEAKVDRYELKELTFRTFASGTYQPVNRRLDSAGLADIPLWVKETDWHRYMSDLWRVRYGIDWANPAPLADTPIVLPHLTSEVLRRPFDNPTTGHENLALWLALELRRSRAAFDKSRKDQDADFEANGMRKCGPRVKATLKSASEICVALADATIAKAGEFQSTHGQLAEAETRVLAFTREIANSAIPLAFFVSGETGLGGSAVKAATHRGAQLCRDIEGAFALAKASVPDLGKQASPIASIFAIWRDEAINEFEVERDEVNTTFAKANRPQSAYHINGLLDAAERTIKALIVRARALPLPDAEWSNLERHAFSVFGELTDHIQEIAIGANGRAPQPDNGAETNRLAQPARERIAIEFEKLRLEKQFSGMVHSTGNDRRAPGPKVRKQSIISIGGRPPEHDWDFMRQLAIHAIASRPTISRSALAESLVSDYGAQKTGEPPVKRTIERKLEGWNLPET